MTKISVLGEIVVQVLCLQALSNGSPSPLEEKESKMGIQMDNGYVYDVSAAPIGPFPAVVPGDAPWTQAEESYRRMITCPRGIAQKPRGIVLLVPGTGANGSEVYLKSPYYQALPSFDVCWLDLPNYSLSDLQLAAEFVAYGIRHLASKSKTTGGKIHIVSYSQGGPNVQWASTFWPSIRPLVIGHVALAPSMKGTMVSALVCPAMATIGGCLPAALQQSKDSHYMEAANFLNDTSGPAYAQIPTTIIYSRNDEIVTPQVGPNASSRLIGASNIGIQDVCGARHVVGHFFIVGDVGAFGIALDALRNGRPAKASCVNRSYCKKTAASLGFQIGNLPTDLREAYRTAIGDDRAARMAASLKKLRVQSEPHLQQYVCDRGYAANCTRNGFRDQPTQPMSKSD